MADATIFIVDKERILVDLLVRVWSSKQIAVIGSTSVDEALRLIDVRMPDLLVVDPGMLNGFTLIASVRARKQATKVIALISEQDVKVRAIAMGVERTVDRHRGLDALVDAIQKTLRAKLIFMEPVNVNVLVVDDEEPLRILLQEFLTSRGFSVSLASTGLQALELIEANAGIQVVLLDVTMPEMNGMEVLSRIMARPQCPSVLMMTALIDRESARHALQIGASDYILKPFDFAAVEASILACTSQPREPWWKRIGNQPQ